MPSAGYVAGDGYCKVSDGECWLHNVNIALCASDVKRLRGPCLSSWAGQPAEAQAARTPPTPARRGAGRRWRSSAARACARPCRLLGARAWTGLWAARPGQSFPPAVGWLRHESTGKFFQHDETRSRRLLLHKAPDSSP